MASTTQIATKSKAYALCHCCSQCGNPIVSPITVTSRVAHAVKMFKDTPASVYADEEIESTAEEIRDCVNTRKPLGDLCVLPNDNVWNGVELRYEIDSRTKATTWVTGLKSFCPACGYVEPWMGTVRTVELKDKLKRENFPTLFDNRERAIIWARLKLQTQAEAIEAQRAVDGAIEEANSKLRQAKEQLQSLTQQLEQEDKNNLLKSYESKIEGLNKEHSACKVFDFKKKKELSGQIDELNEKVKALKTEMNKEKQSLTREKKALEYEAGTLRNIVLGTDGTVEDIVSANAEAFRLRIGTLAD